MKKNFYNAFSIVGTLASIIGLFSANFVLKLIGIIFIAAYIVAITIFVIVR